MIGTGPFTYVSRAVQDNIVLEKFADYWGEGAYVDKVTLKVIEDAILEIMGLTMKAFSNDDVETALRVEPLEKVVDILCNDAKIWHMNRMHKGECTFEHGIIFNDLLTNYERISDHCSNIALTVIELGVDALNTHEYIRNMDKENSEPFATWFKEYMTKFSLKNNEPLQ